MDIAFVNVLITVLTLLCMSSLELSNMYAIVRTFLIDSYLTAFRQALAVCQPYAVEDWKPAPDRNKYVGTTFVYKWTCQKHLTVCHTTCCY